MGSGSNHYTCETFLHRSHGGNSLGIVQSIMLEFSNFVTAAQGVGDLLVSSLVIKCRVSGSDIALICKHRNVLTNSYKS